MLYQRYNNETIVDVCDKKYSMLIIQWEKLLELIEKYFEIFYLHTV